MGGDNIYDRSSVAKGSQDEVADAKVFHVSHGGNIYKPNSYNIRSINVYNDDSCITIYDSAADIHLCNCRNRYIKGTFKKQKCYIVGIDSQVDDNENNYEMISEFSGDVQMKLGKHTFILKNVAYVDVKLDEDERNDERKTLLISIKLVSKYNILGVYFVPGGEHIDFYDKTSKKFLERISVNIEENSYIKRGEVNFNHESDKKCRKTLHSKPVGLNRTQIAPKMIRTCVQKIYLEANRITKC